MLSYHADADIHTNPYELGLDRLVNLDMEADFIGKVTSAVYSPRLEQNIALAMVAVEHANLGAEVEVVNRSGIVNDAGTVGATIVERPFYDPQKKLAAA